MKNILVTGGAGFIGSYLCEELVRENNVVVVDNMSMGNNIEFLDSSNLIVIKLDILHDSFKNIFKYYEFDTVFHLAANSDISNQDPYRDINNTFKTTLRVIEQCELHNIKEIVFASSSAIYGETQDFIMENYGPLIPISHYGAAKLGSEAFLCSYAKTGNFKVWICRFPNVVGKRATHGVIYDLIRKIKRNPEELEVLGNGEQSKPYLHASVLIDAILFIWHKANEDVNIYNISGLGKTTVKDIAEMIVKKSGANTKIKYTGGDRGWVGDCPTYYFNVEKLIRLGWKPKIDSDEAVKRSIDEIWSSI